MDSRHGSETSKDFTDTSFTSHTFNTSELTSDPYQAKSPESFNTLDSRHDSGTSMNFTDSSSSSHTFNISDVSPRHYEAGSIEDSPNDREINEQVLPENIFSKLSKMLYFQRIFVYLTFELQKFFQFGKNKQLLNLNKEFHTFVLLYKKFGS